MPAPSLVKLDFQEKLIQSGRKENTEALLKRIKTLHQKLAVLEQETTDTSSLKGVCKQLVSELILHHKDRGVKAYAACCLADSLRICAPNAPYTMDQLRDIFQFFVAQLTINLKPPPQNARPIHQPHPGIWTYTSRRRDGINDFHQDKLNNLFAPSLGRLGDR